jgi:hypothetical protein
MEEYASQLTQELGGKNSQIFNLTSRIVAQDSRTTALEAELARQKDEIARLRTQLVEAAAVSQSSVATTTVAPDVEPQSSDVIPMDDEESESAVRLTKAPCTDKGKEEVKKPAEKIVERAIKTPAVDATPNVINLNRIYNPEKLKSTVEEAKSYAHDAGRPDLAAYIEGMFQQSLGNARITELFELVLEHSATEEQTAEFQDYVRVWKEKLRLAKQVADDQQRTRGAIAVERIVIGNDTAVLERASPTPVFSRANERVNESTTTGGQPEQRGSLSDDNRSLQPIISMMKPREESIRRLAARLCRDPTDPRVKSKNWPDGRGLLSDDDDNEDPVPESKKEKVPVVAAAAKHAATQECGTTGTPARKRKRAADVPLAPSPGVSKNLQGLDLDDATEGSQRPSTRDHSESQESETSPAKRQRPAPASSTPQKQPLAGVTQTPAKKRTGLSRPYTPLRVSPFQRLTIATPPSPSLRTQSPTTFKVPRSSVGIYGDGFDNTVVTPSKTPSQPTATPAKVDCATTTTSNPTMSSELVETTPFTFKFVVSYAANTDDTDDTDDTDNRTTNMSFYDSMVMEKGIPPFWALLSTLSAKWEEQAGDRWAWEFQKRSNADRKRSDDKMPRRFCITSKLANLPTNWRPLDEGFQTCMDCVVAGRPCFTWAMDKNGGDGEGDDSGEVFGVPKGEFWCLPIHQDDRNCPVEEEFDIRTWVNEGESIYDGHGCVGEETDENGHRAVAESDDEPRIKIEEESSEKYGDSSALPPQVSRRRPASVALLLKTSKKKQTATESEPDENEQEHRQA